MRKVRIITNPERIAPLQPGFTFARYFASNSAGSFWEDDPCQFGRPGPGRPGWLPTPAPLRSFEVALFCDVCGRGGSLLSAELGKMVVTKGTIRQTLRKEPPVLIMQDALPLFKSFLKPVSLKPRARQLVLRCVIAFLMHLGKMSASRVAGAVRTDARHRAQVSRFMGRRYWRRCDLLGQ